eukprot:TRINITY_DN6803_c0_g1_i1.p2 TRINITY_DN6803_c0_g1~~TRINITY_DN6803_c0_g1_i1.p2  ORF type:complete len:295 (-),score=55.10 TRINITY_DN6803_c0_g1_i1:288-1172(-)
MKLRPSLVVLLLLSISWIAAFSALTNVGISYPRCGSTWVRLAVSYSLHLHYNRSTSISPFSASLYSMFKSPPSLYPLGPLSWIQQGHHLDIAPAAAYSAGKNPKRLPSHRIVLLVRDPRDVAISLYHLAKTRPLYSNLTLSQYIRRDNGSMESVAAYFKGWWDSRHLAGDLMLVRYEDLHLDAAGEIARILAFYGFTEIRHEYIKMAARLATFDNMKLMEQEGYIELGGLSPVLLYADRPIKMRRGKANGFECDPDLSRDDLEYMDGILTRYNMSVYGDHPRRAGSALNATEPV